MRDQIAMVLPTLLDGERTDGKIGNVPPRTPASAELPLQPHPPARGPDIGVALMAIAQDPAIRRLERPLICPERLLAPLPPCRLGSPRTHPLPGQPAPSRLHPGPPPLTTQTTP